MDNRDVILAELEACEQLLKYNSDKVDKNILKRRSGAQNDAGSNDFIIFDSYNVKYMEQYDMSSSCVKCPNVRATNHSNHW